MQVKVEISLEYQTPCAVIYTHAMTDEVRRAMEYFESPEGALIAQKGEKLLVLRPRDIYMARIEDGEAFLYTERERLISRRRLYELSAQLGNGFLQISKSCLVNANYLDSIESGFGGSLCLKLKNGLSEYVSRKYLPALKKYLGM